MTKYINLKDVRAGSRYLLSAQVGPVQPGAQTHM